MQKKHISILLILSIVNCFPIMIYVFIYPPSFSGILLLLSFCSPVIAIIYIITTIIFMMLKRFSKVSLGIIIIVINILYLLWSRYYLDVMYHMT